MAQKFSGFFCFISRKNELEKTCEAREVRENLVWSPAWSILKKSNYDPGSWIWSPDIHNIKVIAVKLGHNYNDYNKFTTVTNAVLFWSLIALLHGFGYGKSPSYNEHICTIVRCKRV